MAHYSSLEYPAKRVQVTVVGPKKVWLGDAEMLFTAATRQVIQLDYSVQSSPHWIYNGRLVRDINEEIYADPE